MADIEYFDEGQPQPPSAGIGIVNLIGAGCSVALVLGLSVWAVQLTLRDVADVPVIRALEGPMREQPDDPGGTQAAYQGLTVNGIKAGGEAAPAAERIVLAPPPVSLDATSASAQATAAQPDAAQPSAAPALPLTPDGGFDVDALADQLTAGVDPLEPTLPAEPEQSAAIPASVPGVSRSVRPTGRPANLVTTSRQTASAAPAPTAVDANPAAIPAGARLVQLGAFDSPEVARSEWERLYGQFGDYMEGKQRLVQQATSGGRNFYRLRVVGFADANDARRFCSAFLARNTACIPVTAR